MADSNVSEHQARLYVGMGGSGLKTLDKFVSLLTQHSEESKKSEVFMAYLLVDTDVGELDRYAKAIRDAYKHIFREPIIRTVHLSADITDFSSFVSNKLRRGGHHPRLRDVWWYRTDRLEEPFTALNLKDSPTRGAGQCPLVSTFLAWNKMRTIDTAIDELLNTLKNRSVQGENLQNWTLDVAMVASLAGGTGRGCWHLVAAKIREKLRDLNLRPKPVGFFFDSSVFAEEVKRDEQVMKMRVNSITGVSELIAWLRNEYERDTDLPPFQFRLPSLEDPSVSSSDLIDTTKLSTTVSGDELRGVSGRAPISVAYLVFGAGKQGTLGEAAAYYQSVANALYARLYTSTASKNINESGHLNGLAAATISVSIAGVQEYVREYVKQFLPARYQRPIPEDAANRVVETLLDGLAIPDAVTLSGDPTAANVPQRVYARIMGSESGPGQLRNGLETDLKEREYDEAAAKADELTTWHDDHKELIADHVRQVVISRVWGEQDGPESVGVGGTLRTKCDMQFQLDRPHFDRIYGGNEEVKVVNPIAEAVRQVLRRPAIVLQCDGRAEAIDLTSYGTKLAIASKAAQSLRAIAERVTEQKLPDTAADGQGQAETPASLLHKARQGFLRTNVDAKEAQTVMSSVEPYVLRRSNAVLRRQLRGMLATAADEIDVLGRALRAIVDRLEEVANSRKEKTDRCRENNFWTEQDFAKVLDEGESAFEQKILSAQTLQPVQGDEELHEEFRRLMSEPTEGFKEARDRFVAEMQHWVDSNSGSANGIMDRRLPDVIHENLERMGDQFMLPDGFYESNFGFFTTVKKLMKAWGGKMIERMGAPHDKAKLANVFKNQFGIDYPESAAGGPMQLGDAELREFAADVCAAMAIRLGGRCDPLFQQRFDEGERPTYDSVAVVLPTERIFDKQFAEDAERAARANPQFAAAGQFEVIPTTGELDGGNPYTMVAYATQQFEDWRSDSGMARIASLEYYKMPAVLNWLRACEDPAGASVFLDSDELKRFGIPSCRDIYGLGYISPLFVHDPTLAEFRWSPWNEEKARSADRRQERMDLLAYAMLAPPPRGIVKHFEEVLHKPSVGWTMPLLNLPGSTADGEQPGWRYSRPAVRHCKEVLATKSRDANHPAFAADHGHSSIRRCFDEVMENQDVAAAIAGEASIFMTEILCSDEHADDFDATKDIKIVFRYLTDRLNEVKRHQAGPAAARMKKLIDELLERVAALESLSPEKLREHFELIRRNLESHGRA